MKCCRRVQVLPAALCGEAFPVHCLVLLLTNSNVYRADRLSSAAHRQSRERGQLYAQQCPAGTYSAPLECSGTGELLACFFLCVLLTHS